MSQPRMTAATLFSGIGAPEVAKPDWQWLWHAEIEKFPSAVMAVRHPQSVNLGDVTAHDFCDRALAVGRPDVLVFGSPCQAFSVAGRRLGLDDPRGNLALVALGIVARVKPAWFVFENVPGLLSSAEGRDFGLFLRTVDELGARLGWTVLDAQYFGLAQRRKRVFAVGHFGTDWQRPAAVLLEPEGLCGHPPSRHQAREDTTGTLAARTSAGGGLVTDFDLDGGLVAGTLRSHHGNPQAEHAWTNQLVPDVSPAMKARDAKGASSDGDGDGLPLVAVFDPTQVTSKANRSRVHPGVSHTLPAEGYAPVAYQCQGSNVGAMGTLRSGNGNETGGVPFLPVAFAHQAGGKQTNIGFNAARDTTQTLSAHQHPSVMSSGVRRLMPIECERLQGFPDHYTAITYRGKPAADGPRYKAIGNSMAVPVVRWILNRIEQVSEMSQPRGER